MRGKWNNTDFDLSFGQLKGTNEYNGLKDPNLAGFFALPLRKKFLLKQKLVRTK